MNDPIPVRLKMSAIDEINALVALVDAGLLVMRHVPGCSCEGTDRMLMACVRLNMRGAA